MTEPLVGVVMGSASDWETMQHCARQLETLGGPVEIRVRRPAWFRSLFQRLLVGAGLRRSSA